MNTAEHLLSSAGLLGSSRKMMLIFGLMLLKTAACLELNCRFNQSDPCYAALGDKLNLQMADPSKYNLTIKKKIRITQDDLVCPINKGTIKKNQCDLYNNRPEVSVNNGILIINGVIRADSGIYRLYLYDSDGIETSAGLQVIVKDSLVTPIVLGCLAVIFIALVIMAYYLYKKKNQIKPTTNPVSDGPEPVNEHVDQKNREQKKTDEYATIDSQNKRKNKKKRKRKEEEVHYGEVTFANSSVQQPPKKQEDCVYAQVQTR